MSGPLPSFLAPLTVPASWVYGRVIAARNARFDRGVGVEPIDRPVISVGNITTGGTGKTPMVAWIAQQLFDAGHHPVIAMRGYKSVGGVSDEQAEYAERIPEVPVIANPDRISSLRDFFKVNRQFDGVILDDGFQHRQLKRDLDLVLIDATADTFHDRLLPAGNLREPLSNLRRADAVIVTHTPSEISNLKSDISNLKSQIESVHGKPPVAWSRHVWTGLTIHFREKNKASTDVAVHADQKTHCAKNSSSIPSASSADFLSQPIDWLHGKRVLTMLGIGKPQSVIEQLKSFGAFVAVNIPCADHEHYDQAKITVARGLCTGCEAMIVTQKDWVKLRHLIDLSQWPVPIVVPRLEIEVFQGADALRELVLLKVRSLRAGKPAR